MSSRSFRRLQGKDPLENIDNNLSDSDELVTACGSGARRKVLPNNLFGLLNDEAPSSDEQLEEETEPVSILKEASNKKKNKKKKSSEKKNKNSYNLDGELETISNNGSGELFDIPQVELPSNLYSNNWKDDKTKADSYSLLHINSKNLNMNNELKKIFGSSTIENVKSRRRSHGKPSSLRSFSLVQPRETWSPIHKTGISMKMEKVGDEAVFTFVHSPDYQKIQHMFLNAVDSLNPDNIIAILNTQPYHVDALIQLSDLCKLSDDLQVAVELNERALFCLENAFHHQFNIARGNCRLDYRYQVNRPLFICLLKHLIFVGERACYRTALELCKLLLLLDFEGDPLAVVLCIDFYALRSQNYKWLIDVANEWESKKNLSQLPNFAYSLALAHFYLAEAEESKDLSVADKLLQEALLLFPGILKPLLDKCNIQCDDRVARHSFFSSDSDHRLSNSLKVLMSLYVTRTYHEWKNPKILPWLERNVNQVLHKVDSKDPFVDECEKRRLSRYNGTPSNVLRHVILSDMKEVTSIVNDINTPFVGFDPIPPWDSINIYQRQSNIAIAERYPSLSLFFRSLLPSFNINRQRENGLMGENAEVDANDVQAHAEAPALQETFQHSVTVLMDAIALLLSNIPARRQDFDEHIAELNENVLVNDDGTPEVRTGQNPRPRTDNTDNIFTDSSSDVDGNQTER